MPKCPPLMTAATQGLAAIVLLAGFASAAQAAQCGNNSAGFETWKSQTIAEARAKGVGATALAALETTHYNHPTIGADRGQGGFHVSLEQFMARRATGIAPKGRKLKQSMAGLFSSIEQRYGVPPGPLLAIWGMETGFGAVHGNEDALSATATLAYDCRRSAYFTDQLYAALKLIDRGEMAPGQRGSKHGEIGQTQFLPKTILDYGTGGSLDNASVALSSTANFLKAHGWQRGLGYQPGEPNFAAIQEWNAATVYEKAIAIVGQQIDDGR